MHVKAKDYEREAAAAMELASIVMKKEMPDYGEAERQMARAKQAITYARQINNGTYRGEQH
jgi:hypothetical protein